VNVPQERPARKPSRRAIEAMPKAELHLHLDGSLSVDTALELARSRDVDAPRDRAGMAAALIAPMPCADQAELLRAFDLPIALLQDALLRGTVTEPWMIGALGGIGVALYVVSLLRMRAILRGVA